MADADPRLSLRSMTFISLILEGANPIMASEAVSTTELAHPEWDWEERRTMSEWMNKVDDHVDSE